MPESLATGDDDFASIPFDRSEVRHRSIAPKGIANRRQFPMEGLALPEFICRHLRSDKVLLVLYIFFQKRDATASKVVRIDFSLLTVCVAALLMPCCRRSKTLRRRKSLVTGCPRTRCPALSLTFGAARSAITRRREWSDSLTCRSRFRRRETSVAK